MHRAQRFEVLLFAAGREAAGGAASVQVELAPGTPPTAGAVLAVLRAHPRLGAVAASSRLAVNHTFAAADTPIVPGDELALIPPVGGG
ncbi:MAG: hypothetical protein KatS3mg102_1435 [Planctomycetota bacterium]|nr:MAG: hypothetical protein KatS3mg102_1435 [Planctomycetota bacterium]